MAIHYVDSNAAGANNGTSWANAFADIDTCLTTATFTDTDQVWVAHNHSKDYGGGSNKTLTYPSNNVNFLSVNSGTGAYQSGAVEQNGSATGSQFLLFSISNNQTKITSFKGIAFKSEERLLFQGEGSTWKFSDSNLETFNVAAGPYTIATNADSVLLELDGCTLTVPSNKTTLFQITGGSMLSISNSSIVNTTGATTNLVTSGGIGGARLYMNNVNASGLTGYCIQAPAANLDIMTAEFHKILTNASFTGIVDTSGAGKQYEVYSSSVGGADDYYNSSHINALGESATDLLSYVNGQYDSATGFSTTVDTSAECSVCEPYKVKIGTVPAQDLTTGPITLTVEFTSATASLDDADVYLEAIYQDETNQALGVRLSTEAADILSGTAHITAGTSTWLGSTASLGNDYIETITIADQSATGADNSNIEVYAVITRPSIAVNFDIPV